MQLADRLGMSLQRCQQETTSREFLRWKVYLERDWNVAKPDHYYLAQIAKEIRRTALKNPGSIKLKDFLLKFVNEVAHDEEKSEEEQKLQTAHSKSCWFAGLGISPEGNSHG